MACARVALLVALLACGCASPAARLSSRAADLGFTRAIVAGAGFDHVVFRARAHVGGTSIPDAPRVLHVYLDGDGSPWTGREPTDDPTPRNPLVLRLMALDAAPRIYLGRPCYHGLANAPRCTPALWTTRRYAREC